MGVIVPLVVPQPWMHPKGKPFDMPLKFVGFFEKWKYGVGIRIMVCDKTCKLCTCLALLKPHHTWTTKAMGRFCKQQCVCLWRIGKHKTCTRTTCYVYHIFVKKTTSTLIDSLAQCSASIIYSNSIGTWSSTNNCRSKSYNSL
jgi:hypothetical protein